MTNVKTIEVLYILRKKSNIFRLAIGIVLVLLPMISWADDSLASEIEHLLGSSSMTSRLMQLFMLLTVLGLAPSILIMVTSFVRISIVLSIVRTALGLQQSPPNQVLISLALFLTFFIMSPTLTESYENGLKPMLEETMSETEAFPLITLPFKKFMVLNTRPKDLDLFISIAKVEASKELHDPPKELYNLPLRVIIPSFMISELKRGFEIGFLIFLPFLIIDIVVASILMAMGMMMMPPVMVALPFKIIFFVLVDGWYLLAGSLVQSFVT
jgi:flagellar biosynthetic protein FliP